MTDAPFSEMKAYITGYALIQVKSKEKATEWAKRFCNLAVEVRENDHRNLQGCP